VAAGFPESDPDSASKVVGFGIKVGRRRFRAVVQPVVGERSFQAGLVHAAGDVLRDINVQPPVSRREPCHPP
jgi:hypothetical protein